MSICRTEETAEIVGRHHDCCAARRSPLRRALDGSPGCSSSSVPLIHTAVMARGRTTTRSSRNALIRVFKFSRSPRLEGGSCASRTASSIDAMRRVPDDRQTSAFAFDSIRDFRLTTRSRVHVERSRCWVCSSCTSTWSLARQTAHLPLGLSVVLGFIGVKLILEALHATRCHSSTMGSRSAVPEVTWLSLAVIVFAIGGAALASVIK